MAIHIYEPDLAQPPKLRLAIKQLVRGILGFHGESDARQELLMQSLRRRRYVLEVTKHSAGIQLSIYLRVQLTFALVHQMMDRKTGNHRIKLAQAWQGSIQIVFDHCNPGIARKPPPRCLEHGRRKVQRHGISFRICLPHKRKQAPVSRAQIKNASHIRQNEFQQRCFSFRAMGNKVCTLQILAGVLARSPQIDRFGCTHAGNYTERINSFSMNSGERHWGGIRKLLFWVVLIAALCTLNAPAQNPTDQRATQAQPVGPQEPTKPVPPPEQPQQPPQGEVKITPRQAEELFHSVDEILQFDSKQTGMPIKHDVKRKLTSRDEVESYLTSHLNDEDTQRLRRSESVLKKFGLLPRDFNLETFLVALLKEEVAGYYDPKTKTVNLLDWVPLEEQEPVMAHELTHALQDQEINLQKWMKKGEKDLAEIRKDPTPVDIENDEIDNAREAVLEGQAQAMMFQYAIAPTGHTIQNSPALVGAMQEETLTGTPGTKVFNEAPIFLKESLTFPYSYGMDFVIKVMQAGGKDRAFAGVLQNPPHTTRQIMQPEMYLSGEKIEPMRLPDFKHDFKDYKKFDIGAMGEFDVAVLMDQYVGKKLSKKVYPEWRGGYYYAAKPKSDPNAPLGLLYVSRWSSPEAAAEFAGIYASSLKQRYKKLEGAASDSAPQPQSELPDDVPSLNGRHAWSTDEGTVLIEQQGDLVIITESLDANTTSTLEKEMLAAPIAKK
jgi:hypothetical protein